MKNCKKTSSVDKIRQEIASLASPPRNDKNSKKWLELTITIPTSRLDIISLELFQLGSAGLWEEDEGNNSTTIRAYFNKDATHLGERLSIPPDKISTTIIKSQDWATNWRQDFVPFEIAKGIVIKPSWEKYSGRANEIIITLDPGMAFGTGTHPTTRLCAGAIVAETSPSPYPSPTKGRGNFSEEKILRMLDYGTGSGILSIIAAKLGVKEITAIDSDPDAIEIARQNIIINQCDRYISVKGNIRKFAGQFNLITANILLSTLIDIRRKVYDGLKPGGTAILSGITEDQEADILRHYATPLWMIRDVRRMEEWSAVILEKRG